MKTKVLSIFLIVLFGITTGCKKYEDGPMISLYTKKRRLSGTWEFAKVTENNIDKTENYYRMFIQFTKDGDVIWNQNNDYSNNLDNIIIGDWEFSHNKERLITKFNEGLDDEFTYEWEINQLKYHDMKLYRKDGEIEINWDLYKYR